MLNSYEGKIYGQNPKELHQLERRARQLNPVQKDSALFYYEEAIRGYAALNDSVALVKCLIDEARIHSSSGHYNMAYDKYWEALALANRIDDAYQKSEIYLGLATLYSIFNRNTRAEHYSLQALKLKKQLVASGALAAYQLSGNYTMLTNHYISLENYAQAQNYLDTAYAINEVRDRQGSYPYLDVLQGRIYYFLHRYDEARVALLKAKKYLPQPVTAYYTIVYYYLGDVYYAMDSLETSESYLLKSIALSDHYQSFQNNVSKVYRRLAGLYAAQGNMAKAYHYQIEGDELVSQLFDARSPDKVSMLEIKDAYRLAMEAQAKDLEKARLGELEQKQEILFLRNIILSVSALAFLVLALFTFFYLQNKRRAERRLHENKQKLMAERNHEILELKNKELTASALKLIQKDELLTEIKYTLQSKEDSGTKEKVLRQIKINSKQDWTEFDARFTSVNKDFYNQLANLYPGLTPRDHKLCALIKLNFSSKEMAQLLGISMESVNTSRYRLRKKMKLQKSDNLVEVIRQL